MVLKKILVIDDEENILTTLKGVLEDEKFIVENRFLSQDPMTFRDLAKKLKISREWVRKLEIRALDRMRKYLAREHDIRDI